MSIIKTIEYIKAAKAKFYSYGDEWIKAYFDEESGGFNVYHTRHQFTNICGGAESEKTVGYLLSKLGKQVEFLPEGGQKSPDIKFDKQTWDIKYIDNANEETIRKSIRDAQKADNAIFYFTKQNQYQLLKNATEREAGRFLKKQISKIPDIYYIDIKRHLLLLWGKRKGLNE